MTDISENKANVTTVPAMVTNTHLLFCTSHFLTACNFLCMAGRESLSTIHCHSIAHSLMCKILGTWSQAKVK